MAKRDTLVRLRRPRRAGIRRRDHLGQLAILVGIFVVETGQELGDRTHLTLGCRPVDLAWRLAVIATGISFHDARIDREPFALDEPSIHARLNHRFEQLPKDVAIAEAAVTIDRERRMIGHLIIETEAAEPTICEV
jgi:hypothetical protein